MRMTKRFRANLALFAVTVLVCLLAGEASVRVLFPQWRDIWPQSFLRIDPVPGRLTGTPGHRGHLTNAKGEFHVPVALDAEGFRNSPSKSTNPANRP
jgi:hypothetical protein